MRRARPNRHVYAASKLKRDNMPGGRQLSNSLPPSSRPAVPRPRSRWFRRQRPWLACRPRPIPLCANRLQEFLHAYLPVNRAGHVGCGACPGGRAAWLDLARRSGGCGIGPLIDRSASRAGRARSSALCLVYAARRYQGEDLRAGAGLRLRFLTRTSLSHLEPFRARARSVMSNASPPPPTRSRVRWRRVPPARRRWRIPRCVFCPHWRSSRRSRCAARRRVLHVRAAH